MVRRGLLARYRRMPLRGRVRAFLVSYPILLLLLLVQHRLYPQRAGVLALLQVWEPYLFLPLLVLAPLAFLRGNVAVRLLMVVALLPLPVLYPVRILDTSSPTSLHETAITVMNWNVQWSKDAEQRPRVRSILETRPADVIVLEEANWEWLRSDPAIVSLYPHQLIRTPQASSGIVLLSSYPFLDSGVAEVPRGVRGWPRLIWAQLDIGNGRTLKVIAAHPGAPTLNLGFDPTERESLLPRVREFVDPALATGEPLVLLGDFNMTEREPIYGDIARGMTDAFRSSGQGTGNTWGVDVSTVLLMPLIRLDYIFVGNSIIARSSSVDCSARGSDHCIIRSTLSLT